MAATRHNRRISPGLRADIFTRSQEHCQRCGTAITLEKFHVAHLRAASHGGPAVLANLEAWCVPCNLSHGNIDVLDTRQPLRPWQKEALPRVLDAITGRGVSTVMAAPGAGKTVFAGAVFAAGQEAGLWERLLVIVPRAALVEQWKRSLLENCHIGLDTKGVARSGGLEMDGMDGICLTYQGLLSQDAQRRHLSAIRRTRTLVVLDEVHHLGEPITPGRPTKAWSDAIQEIAGDVEVRLHAAGVLNMSGTLFRTAEDERISTVLYDQVEGDHGEPRIQAITDYDIHPDRLVREGVLRAPDLFRMGARVEILNHATSEVTAAGIADLKEESARAALRSLNWQPDWVQQLVTVTLNELETRHRDSAGAPIKGLIVAHRQEMAREFRNEVNRQMTARGLRPLAESVTSEDGANAFPTLERFRKMQRVGVLCTVGMAGEGYDCPDIAVVTYATNVQTAQNIRQVVARGQRVTEWERARSMKLSTAIIVPDVPDLVELFVDILAPMVHEIQVPTASDAPPAEDGGAFANRSPGQTEIELLSAEDTALDVVSAINATGSFDVSPAAKDLLMPLIQAANLPEHWWPRLAQFADMLGQSRPFSPTLQMPEVKPARPEPSTREVTPREAHDAVRKDLAHASRWWAHVAVKQGGTAVQFFITEIYGEAGITEIERASVMQIKRAIDVAYAKIRRFCAGHNLAVPRFARN